MDDLLRFHPRIAFELDDAISQYLDYSITVANRLRGAFADAFENIASNPEMYAVIYDNVRIVRTRKFPNLVHYRILTDAVQVIAVFHSSTDPSEWRKNSAER